MAVFLGIDTSNYTTSVAAYDSNNGKMISEKKLLPVSENQCGLRQSDAVFHHVKQLSQVCRSVISQFDEKPCAVGFSKSPCDFEGSYMPCFLVGKMLGETLAEAYNAKKYAFSHQRGHIAAALFSVSRLDMVNMPFLALHLSGGTTDLLRVTPDKEKIISIEQIGKSLDLKAGQAVDRIGVMLGLSFPCGMELEKMAQKSKAEFKIKKSVNGLNCSLSGVENKAKKMLDDGAENCDIAKFCIEYIGENIMQICKNALKENPNYPFVFAGGVMSNKYLQDKFRNEFGGYYAEPKFSSDNAAGIAALTKIAYERNLDEYKCEK